MANHVVNRGANGFREALVIQGCRYGIKLIDDVIVANSVEFTGRDAGLYFRRDHFQNLGGELAIKTANVGFAAYFEEIGRVGLIEDNKGKTIVNISGTKMREILGNGEMPDERVMRPSTAKILVDYYAKNKS